MAVLFRPHFPVDKTHWVPALRRALDGMDFRVWPETGAATDIEYLIVWRLREGDHTAFPNLRAVLSLSAGINQYAGHPEFPAGARLVRMIEPGLRQGMLEYVASYALRFHREHDMIAAHAANMEWFEYIPKVAAQRTVGVMGLGELGAACAASLAGLGFNVLGWSRSRKEIPGVTSFGEDGLDAFLAQSEILICLLPLTATTENILGRRTLGLLPKGAFVINAARGHHVVDEDLLALLDSGHLAGAALDVFRKEPLPQDHPFWTHPKIHVTPHLAAITIPETGAQSIRASIAALQRGENPPGLVDFGRGY